MAYGVDTFPVVGEHNEIHTTQKNPLGTVAKFSDGNYYIYLAGVANQVAGDHVHFGSTYAATRIVAGLKGGVAIAQAATVANTWGWYGFVGTFTGASIESSCLSNAYLYTTGSAGELDDAITKNEQVKGMTTRTAGVAGGTATVQIFPGGAHVGSNDESA